MNKLVVNVGVILCGLSTALLAVFINTAIAADTGFNVFRFMVQWIIPMGSLGLGLLAASGFYGGAGLLGRRATPALLVQMVLVALLTHALMYWCAARWVAVPLVAPGARGAATLLLEFTGLLIGTVATYLQLQQKPDCKACGCYLRKLHRTRSKYFSSAAAAGAYSTALRRLPMDSADFGAMAALRCNAPTVTGAFAIHTRLMRCPACNEHVLSENVATFHNKLWHQVDGQRRRIVLPAGVDLAPYFRR